MKTAVVTGGGRGLGHLIAKGLAEKGYSVLVTDLDADAAERSAADIGRGAFFAQHDVRDADAHRRMAEKAAERGELSVWVNNAGVLKSADAWEHSEEDTRLQVDVNVLGVIFGSQAAVNAMKSTAGHIINIASISALLPTPGLAVYGATKHAVLGFSTSLQGDLKRAGYNIAVSALCPDAIDTHMVKAVETQEEAALLFSSGKLLEPEKVAAQAVGLVDHPQLVKVTPAVRGILAHLVHPFPQVGLKVLEGFRKIGERNRQKRS